MNECNVSSKNNQFMIKMYMNLPKIIIFISVYLCALPLYSKSVDYTSSYYSKSHSIEFKNNNNKLKLNLLEDRLYISSLNIQIDNFLLKKGKVCHSTNLVSGVHSNIFVNWKIFDISYYLSLPSECEDHFIISGIIYEKNSLKIDISVFEDNNITNDIYLKNYFYSVESIKDLKKGSLCIFDFHPSIFDLHYELVNSISGVYYSSYFAININELKIFFEQQNLNYLYNLGVKLKTSNVQFSYTDCIYPQSNFSGKQATRKYIMESTVFKTFNKNLLFNFRIKSLRLKIGEEISFDNNSASYRSQSIYATLLFSNQNKCNIDLKLGVLKNKPSIELTLNNLKIGYNSKGFYNSLVLKFSKLNVDLVISYTFKKKFDIKVGYKF